jgi:hypothetical protein
VTGIKAIYRVEFSRHHHLAISHFPAMLMTDKGLQPSLKDSSRNKCRIKAIYRGEVTGRSK